MQNRPLRDFERGAHLHVLDWSHQTARYRFQAAGQVQVKAAAEVFASQARYLNNGPPELPSLAAAITGELSKLYALGHATVRSELDHQRSGDALPIGLSSPPGQGVMALAVDEQASAAPLAARAQLAAAAVAHEIWQAVHRGRLQGISSQKALRQLGQDAGAGALRVAASHHAGGAISAGRHAAALQAKATIIGGRYTSVLDKNSCGPCIEADTGQLLPLGDPAWIPTPNPACLGGDRCRCIIVYQLSSETSALPVAAGR